MTLEHEVGEAEGVCVRGGRPAARALPGRPPGLHVHVDRARALEGEATPLYAMRAGPCLVIASALPRQFTWLLRISCESSFPIVARTALARFYTYHGPSRSSRSVPARVRERDLCVWARVTCVAMWRVGLSRVSGGGPGRREGWRRGAVDSLCSRRVIDRYEKV